MFSENNSLPYDFFCVVLLCSFCPFKNIKVEGEYYKNRQEQWFMFLNVNTSPFEEMNDVGLTTRGGRRSAQRDKEELTHLYCA